MSFRHPPPSLPPTVLPGIEDFQTVGGRKIKTFGHVFIAISVTVLQDNFLKHVQIRHSKAVLLVFLVAF
jgi:hypothetical protein